MSREFTRHYETLKKLHVVLQGGIGLKAVKMLTNIVVKQRNHIEDLQVSFYETIGRFLANSLAKFLSSFPKIRKLKFQCGACNNVDPLISYFSKDGTPEFANWKLGIKIMEVEGVTNVELLTTLRDSFPGIRKEKNFYNNNMN